MFKKPDFNDLFAKWQEQAQKEDPLRKPLRKIFDADIDSPDVYFMMDEIEGVQILRKQDKSNGQTRYAGTYAVLYKTDDADKFYLIMTRIEDEAEVDMDLQNGTEERDALIVCQYTPGVKGRIYMQGVSEETMQKIIDEYAGKKNYR